MGDRKGKKLGPCCGYLLLAVDPELLMYWQRFVYKSVVVGIGLCPLVERLFLMCLLLLTCLLRRLVGALLATRS